MIYLKDKPGCLGLSWGFWQVQTGAVVHSSGTRKWKILSSQSEKNFQPERYTFLISNLGKLEESLHQSGCSVSMLFYFILLAIPCPVFPNSDF